MNTPRLVSIRVDRRSVSIAVFDGMHMDYAQTRQLSSSLLKAEASAAGFLNWIDAKFTIESIAVHERSGLAGPRSSRLYEQITAMFSARGIPTLTVHLHELLSAFGVPPLKSLSELRTVARTIWPVLNNRSFRVTVLDAAALGLFVQTGRLLTINSTPS
jgi:hypothetical protein